MLLFHRIICTLKLYLINYYDQPTYCMSQIIYIFGNNGDLSILEFFILCFSSFLTSVITASFGLGGGVLLIIIMVSIMNPLVIIPIHGIIQISSNSSRAIMLRKNIDYTYLPSFMIGSLFGVGIAAIILIDLPKHLIQSAIGIFIIYSIYAPQFKNIKITNLKIGLVGVISSFLTMFVGSSGPIIVPFIRSYLKDRKSTVATQAAFMTWKHGIKIITFLFLGFSFTEYIPLIFGMILFGLVGTWVGKTILTKLPEKLFGRIFNIILTILASRLIFEGLRQII